MEGFKASAHILHVAEKDVFQGWQVCKRLWAALWRWSVRYGATVNFVPREKNHKREEARRGEAYHGAVQAHLYHVQALTLLEEVIETDRRERVLGSEIQRAQGIPAVIRCVASQRMVVSVTHT
jgi:hypothetical protein